MREPENLSISYTGYIVPSNKDEVELEVLGLELAIRCAKQRIVLLKQGLKISQMQAESVQERVDE